MAIQSGQPRVSPGLLSESDRQFSFGTVISRPGRKLYHRYHLINATSHDVKIVELINRKPCCGIIQIGAKSLRPGESTDVQITFVVGEKFGPVDHEMELVTDLPGDSSIILRTSAFGQPALRVEEDSHSSEPLILGHSKARRSEFRILAAGTATEKPFDLALANLVSTIPVEWAGPKEQGLAEDDTTVESRRFVATLDPSGSVGDHRAEILIRDGDDVLLKHTLIWEVVEPIVATPKVVVLKSDGLRHRIILRSRDGSKFLVTRIECEDPAIKAVASGDVASSKHLIEVERLPKASSNGRGVVRMFTDNIEQGKVELPYVILD